MTLRPNQPQSIGGVLDTIFRLFKSAVVPTLPLSALSAVVSSLPSVYLVARVMTVTDNTAEALATAQDATYVAMTLVSVLVSIWIYAALVIKIDALASGQEMSIGAAFRQGSRRAPVLLVVSILVGLAVIVGSLLLLIPGIILSVSLLPSFCLTVLERNGPIQSLKDSHRLVWGNWWRTTAIFTVGLIVATVIALVAGIIAGVIMPFLGLDNESVVLYTLLATIGAGVVVGLLTPPFYVSLLLGIYWDLKLRKEGGDLAARVGALNAA